MGKYYLGLLLFIGGGGCVHLDNLAQVAKENNLNVATTTFLGIPTGKVLCRKVSMPTTATPHYVVICGRIEYRWERKFGAEPPPKPLDQRKPQESTETYQGL